MIKFQITSVRPKQMFMQVRYTQEGFLPFLKNFNPTQFDAESLLSIAQAGVVHAERYWSTTAELPDSVELDVSVSSGVIKTEVREDAPTFDPNTQVLEQTQTATTDSIVYGWTVRDKTEEELYQELSAWRESASISMRQCRRVLFNSGLLDSVEPTINALPEPDRSVALIEWNSAGTVERLSPMVSMLGASLGMSEAQLDDLFKYAMTL